MKKQKCLQKYKSDIRDQTGSRCQLLYYVIPLFFIKTGHALTEEDILNSHAVHSKAECSLKCLQTSTCVSYNYRSNSNKYDVNCQLSNKTRGGDKEKKAKGK